MNFNLDEKALLWLDYFSQLTYKKKDSILSLFSTPSEMFLNFKTKKESILKIIDEKQYSLMLDLCTEKAVDLYINKMEKLGVSFVTNVSNNYPINLLNIDTPPFVLYYKGDLSLTKELCISVIGTRKPSIYGKTVTENFTKELVEVGFCIVSGLATGTDTIAHKVALENKGKTIAVVAGGLDNIYPSVNFSLSNEIANKGLLISEQPLGVKPEAWLFPIRNRIIAGLSKGVLITEATLKSGSFHTKNYAIEYSRDVFAVPGSIFNPQSLGCNEIISKGEAKLVQNIEGILEEYNLIYNRKETKEVVLSSNEKMIVKIIEGKEVSYQEILIKSKLDSKTLNSLLTTLIFRGIIKKLAGNFYCLL